MKNRTRALALISTPVLAAALALTATPAQAAAPRLVYEGDSWVYGTGDRDPSNGLGPAPVAAKLLGATLTQDGYGGSGYENPSNGAGITKLYNTRLYKHASPAVNLLVLEGSTNDRQYVQFHASTGKWDTANYAGHVNMTLRTAKRLYPNAKIVVVGPTSPSGNPDDQTRKIDEVLARYTDLNGVHYDSLIKAKVFVPGDWSRYSDAESGHPNNAAYIKIGTQVAAYIKEL